MTSSDPGIKGHIKELSEWTDHAKVRELAHAFIGHGASVERFFPHSIFFVTQISQENDALTGVENLVCCNMEKFGRMKLSVRILNEMVLISPKRIQRDIFLGLANKHHLILVA